MKYNVEKLNQCYNYFKGNFLKLLAIRELSLSLYATVKPNNLFKDGVFEKYQLE